MSCCGGSPFTSTPRLPYFPTYLLTYIHPDPALAQTLEADSLEEATQVKLARRFDRAQRAADSDDEGVSDNEDDQEAEGEEDGAVGSASDTTAVGAYVVFKQHLEENQPRSTAKSPRAKTQKKPMPRKALRDDFSDEEESGFRDEMEEDEGDEDEDEDESTTSSGRRRGKSRGSSSSRSSTANRPSMLESVVEDDNEEPEPFSDDGESVVSNGSKVGDKRNKSYGSTSSKARKKARGGALVSPVPAADADSGDSDVSVVVRYISKYLNALAPLTMEHRTPIVTPHPQRTTGH